MTWRLDDPTLIRSWYVSQEETDLVIEASEFSPAPGFEFDPGGAWLDLDEIVTYLTKNPSTRFFEEFASGDDVIGSTVAFVPCIGSVQNWVEYSALTEEWHPVHSGIVVDVRTTKNSEGEICKVEVQTMDANRSLMLHPRTYNGN
ncbi:MAG: hypothetical protein AAFV53_15755 [Myxococcota bacterium]